MEKKRIAIGVDSFKRLIDEHAYYVDKSLMIKELVDSSTQITLITRPRRFGKTLNMSMMRYFFERPECRRYMLEEKDMGYLFENLKIWQTGEDYVRMQGKYPVVYLTMKNAKQTTWKETLENLKKAIAGEYERHRYLLESDMLSERQKKDYIKIQNLEANDMDYTDFIFNLCTYLERYFGEKCMVFIDEYDTPIQSGYLEGYFEEVMEFMKNMLVKGFKDNNALKQGVLTGIMKVAKESIFSDFNNPVVCTVLSQEYADCFGFTEEEVGEMAQYYGCETQMSGIREWYNGYRFGLGITIYNPWSILNYMRRQEDGFKPYWVNTSSNSLIKEVMQLHQVEGKKTIEALLNGESVKKEIQESVIYHDAASEVEDYTVQEGRHENFHHGFILGLMMFASEVYQIESNRELGLGRPDIVLIPKDRKKTAYIFEFKWDSTKGKRTLDQLAEQAMTQIEEKRYKDGLQAAYEVRDVVGIGIGFKGKELKMIMR